MNRLRMALTHTLGGSVAAVVLAYALLFQLVVAGPALTADAADPAHLVLCSGLADGAGSGQDAPSPDLAHKCCLALCRLAGGAATALMPRGGVVLPVLRRAVIATLDLERPAIANGRAVTPAFARGPPRDLPNG